MIVCDICQHYCSLEEEETGRCSVIKNVHDSLQHTEHSFSNIVVEPIEKKPFFHFMPGTRWLSVGFWGCNLSCYFCQNHRISQDMTGKRYDADIVELAKERCVAGIAFTYNEPTLYYPKIIEIGEAAKEIGLNVAVKTNGLATKKTLRKLDVVDAYNVDIKGNDSEYKKFGGRLDHVLDSIEIICEDKHLEVSYLVLPEILEDNDFHLMIAKYLSGLSSYIPVHILYAYPVHNLSSSYDKEELIRVYDIFRSEMNFVYISNVYSSGFSKYRDTYCPVCSELMISRDKYVDAKSICCCDRGICGETRFETAGDVL